MSKSRKQKKSSNLRRSITLWHKRIGLTSALIVILLSVTGIFLNHTDDFGLDHRFISNAFLLDLYQVPEPSVRSFQLRNASGDAWISGSDHKVFFNSADVATCEGRLVGVAQMPDYWVAACSQALILFTPDNEIIEVVDAATELPLPVTQIGLCENLLCIEANTSIYQVDLEAFAWQEVEPARSVDWSSQGHMPSELESAVKQEVKRKVISWEKLMLDIHAGRFLGAAGPWLLDVFALFFCFFAASGIYIWSAKRAK